MSFLEYVTIIMFSNDLNNVKSPSVFAEHFTIQYYWLPISTFLKTRIDNTVCSRSDNYCLTKKVVEIFYY
jgi:hypothetical protein